MRSALLPFLGAAIALPLAVSMPGSARAECPDLNELTAALQPLQQRERQSAAIGQATSLQDAARHLHERGDDAGCARVAQQGLALLRRAASVDLLPVADLTGARVEDAQGRRVGTLSDIVLDVGAGQAAFAVVRTRGFLGIGGDAYAVPWRLLGRKPDGETLVLSVPEQRLQAAPRFDRDVWRAANRADWARSIYTYYGVEPSWEVAARMTSEAAMGEAASASRLEGLAEQLKGLQATIAESRQSDRAALDEIGRRIESLAAKVSTLESTRPAASAPPEATPQTPSTPPLAPAPTVAPPDQPSAAPQQ